MLEIESRGWKVLMRGVGKRVLEGKEGKSSRPRLLYTCFSFPSGPCACAYFCE